MSELSGASPSTNPSDGVITPELALVSPELAEQARTALPDRPWEQFVPPRRRLAAVPGPTRLASLPRVTPISEPRSVAQAPRPAAPLPPDERPVAVRAPVSPTTPSPVTTRRPRGWGRLSLVAGITARSLAALVWASDRTQTPSLVPAEAHSPAGMPRRAKPARESATAAVQAAADKSATTQPAVTRAQGGSATPTTTQPTPRKPSRAAARFRPLPRGGYVFDGGVVVGDPNGRSVTVRLFGGCAADHSTPALRVVRGRFRYDGPSTSRDGDVRLHVAGRFASHDHLRVTVAIAGPTCHVPARTLTATLT